MYFACFVKKILTNREKENLNYSKTTAACCIFITQKSHTLKLLEFRYSFCDGFFKLHILCSQLIFLQEKYQSPHVYQNCEDSPFLIR